MSKTTEIEAKASQADVLKQALQVRLEARDSAHSTELRQVIALEQIADELTAIRVHLIGEA